MLNESFWLLISFLILLFLIYKLVLGKVLKALDDRAEKIKKELDLAIKLKEEAEQIYAEQKISQQKIEKEAEEILHRAENTLRKSEENSKKELSRAIHVKKQLAIDHIRKRESDMIELAKQEAVDEMIYAIEKVLKSEISKAEAKNNIDKIIERL